MVFCHKYCKIIFKFNRFISSNVSLDKALSIKGKGNVESAIAVGKLIAERAKTSGVTQVFFD